MIISVLVSGISLVFDTRNDAYSVIPFVWRAGKGGKGMLNIQLGCWEFGEGLINLQRIAYGQ